MTIKTSARPVLILATGLFVCFAGPSSVAAGADDKAVTNLQSASTESGRGDAEFAAVQKYAKHSSRHQQKNNSQQFRQDALETSNAAPQGDATQSTDGG